MARVALLVAVLSSGVDHSRIKDVRGCGPLALQVCAELNQVSASAARITELVPAPEGECSLFELERAAQLLGLQTTAIEWTGPYPPDVAVTTIVPVTTHDGRRHFVVLVRSEGDQVQIIDYPNDPVWVPASSLADAHWNGVALHISSDPEAIADLRRMAEGDWRQTAGWIGGAVLLALVMGGVERIWSKRRDHVPA